MNKTPLIVCFCIFISCANYKTTFTNLENDTGTLIVNYENPGIVNASLSDSVLNTPKREIKKLEIKNIPEGEYIFNSKIDGKIHGIYETSDTLFIPENYRTEISIDNPQNKYLNNLILITAGVSGFLLTKIVMGDL